MLNFRLDDDEFAAIRDVVEEFADRCGTVESVEFHRKSQISAQEVPGGRAPRSTSGSDPLRRTGVTGQATCGAVAHDMLFFLVVSLLAGPIDWASKQDGRIMLDIFPIKEQQHE